MRVHPCSFFRRSVGKNSDLVLGDLGDQVNEPDNEVADTGAETEDPGDKGHDVLGLEVTDDAVNAADEGTEEKLKQDLGDLRQSRRADRDLSLPRNQRVRR